ncbi:DUF4091 domain-containing protein [Chryseolinea soli]|uniref:DUF4091 domain-containing protein n=1 Tax=Chryseolinea soli TaxID=2321403 RepID=A0A385STP5_9BACT|nr:DUF4091 domain-containing protein [Chryseolinea soli]AYB34284.1 DUF4091 domain-containing protein [Chryseolinea soli]
MQKISALIFLLLFSLTIGFGQAYKGLIEASKVVTPDGHYQDEYTFDASVDPQRWTKEKPGLHISFASTDKLYFRSEVPDLQPESLVWEQAGWRGERLNTTLVVWSPDTLDQVRFVLHDLVGSKGAVLKKENIKLNLVRYVLSNYPYGASNLDCGPSPYKDVFLMPDRFEPFERFQLPGRTSRPVWLSLEVPAGTEPGQYQGTIDVKTDHYSATLTLKIKVQQPTLPPPSEWKFRLDLWQNPWVLAWYNHVEPWSEEHKLLLKKHMKLYADAGGKYITTYAVHSPWADNSFRIEGTMIDWTKQADGSWKFDYDIFDQYVTLAMEAGVDEAITIYSPVPWGNRFRYRDGKTGNYAYEIMAPDSKEYKAFWNIFLTDLKAHLQRKGWFEKTYIGINESEMKQTLAAIQVVKDHSKDWRITYAGDWHKELDLLLSDYSFLYGKEPSMKEAAERSARGASSTYYVCCNPAKPNNFVFSPPIEGRWISWYAVAYGYDGFLRWAYDAWPEDPTRDARHGSWAAGDCFLVYPGANSGIRFEKLREGISDAEKIRVLREKAAKSTDKNVKKLMLEFDQHLKSFTTERDFNEQKITDAVQTGEKLLDQLSETLK